MSEKTTQEQDRTALSAINERRFDAWLAGATEAQVERFKKLQAGVPVLVRDDELPPALRGGALEVF